MRKCPRGLLRAIAKPLFVDGGMAQV